MLALTKDNPDPRRKLAVFDDFGPDEGEVARAYASLAPALVQGPSADLFISVDDIRDRAEACLGELQFFYRDAAGLMVSHMQRLLEVCPSIEGRAARYLAVWCVTHRRSPVRGVYFHFDANVRSKDVATKTRHPMWGTILYMSPDAEIEGGRTCFCVDYPIPEALLPHLFGFHADVAPIRRAAGEWLEVRPKRNRLAIFHGGLAHYVEPVVVTAQRPRLTFCVNFWDELPAEEDRLHGSVVLSDAPRDEILAQVRLP